jgi:hypothetical protein
VHADESTALASGAGCQMALLDDHDALDAGPGEMKGGTQAIDACADDDNICRLHVFSILNERLGTV